MPTRVSPVLHAALQNPRRTVVIALALLAGPFLGITWLCLGWWEFWQVVPLGSERPDGRRAKMAAAIALLTIGSIGLLIAGFGGELCSGGSNQATVCTRTGDTNLLPLAALLIIGTVVIYARFASEAAGRRLRRR